MPLLVPGVFPSLFCERPITMPAIRITVLLACCLLCMAAAAAADKGKAPAPTLAKAGAIALAERFDGSAIPPAWTVNKGNWQIKEGAVTGREKKADMHAAVLTLRHPHRDAIAQFSFKLDGATGFNLSFNHAKGHLFRVVVSQDGLTISKDKDKADPDSKPLVLAKADGKFPAGQWHTLLVETRGEKVAVSSDNGLKLTAADSALNVEKTGYRFVTRGESLLIDDVTVWQVAP
jgi:hypothetical protein